MLQRGPISLPSLSFLSRSLTSQVRFRLSGACQGHADRPVFKVLARNLKGRSHLFGFLMVNYVQVEGAVGREGICPNSASQQLKTLEIVNHGAEPLKGRLGGWDVLE